MRHAHPTNCVGKQQFLNAKTGNAYSELVGVRVQAITGFNPRAVNVRFVDA